LREKCSDIKEKNCPVCFFKSILPQSGDNANTYKRVLSCTLLLAGNFLVLSFLIGMEVYAPDTILYFFNIIPGEHVTRGIIVRQMSANSYFYARVGVWLILSSLFLHFSTNVHCYFLLLKGKNGHCGLLKRVITYLIGAIFVIGVMVLFSVQKVR